jgi:hypothetical protein
LANFTATAPDAELHVHAFIPADLEFCPASTPRLIPVHAPSSLSGCLANLTATAPVISIA